jgi:uncharacterized protein GlcG (DUF336 family)
VVENRYDAVQLDALPHNNSAVVEKLSCRTADYCRDVAAPLRDESFSSSELWSFLFRQSPERTGSVEREKEGEYMITIAKITLAKAQEALKASEAKAKDLGVAVSTAIVDDHGDLIALTRMDNALKISPKFAHAKAFTSAVLEMPSGDVANYAGEGKPYVGVNVAFAGELVVIAGGFPIKQGNQVIGAIGVGGSHDVNNDVLCAQEAKRILEA